MIEITPRLDPVRLRRLDQTVEIRARLRPGRGVGKQSTLSAYDERPDRRFARRRNR